MSADYVDIAWAAGLFEGEGCITVARNGRSAQYPHARVKIKMTDEDVVRRFLLVVEVGRVREEPCEIKHGYKMQWEWYVTNQEGVKDVLTLLLPYLGERRRARAVEVLALVEGQLEARR